MEQSEKLAIFCKNVEWLRKHHNLTQREMAQCLGIGVVQLRRMERGECPKRLGAMVLVRISKQFQITTNGLWKPL